MKKYSEGEILRYMRERHRLTRKEMGTFLDVSEATIKRIEANQAKITLSSLEQLKGLGLTCLMLLDGVVKLQEDQDTTLFKIPAQYSQEMFTSGKLINILRSYYISKLSVKSWNDMLSSVGVDSLRFVNENNRASAQLTHRIIQEMTIKGIYHLDAISAFGEIVQTKIFNLTQHGSDIEKVNHLEIFISQIPNFEQDMRWSILDRKASTLDISIVPAEHIDTQAMFIADPIARGAPEQWMRAMVAGSGLKVKIVEALHKGEKRCLLKVS